MKELKKTDNKEEGKRREKGNSSKRNSNLDIQNSERALSPKLTHHLHRQNLGIKSNTMRSLQHLLWYNYRLQNNVASAFFTRR